MLRRKIKNILSPSDKERQLDQQMAVQAMKETIRERRKSDPLIAPKLKQGGQPEEKAFVIANGKDGKKYFFWRPAKQAAAEDQYSVWSLAAGVATHLGCQQPVDVAEIFRHVAATVGGPEFGIPRIPEGHRPADPPSNWVKYGWPKALAMIQDYCESPSEWPMTFGIV